MKSQREHWATKIGFIMATAGSAIGLGALWRFPYITAQNGGGLFVLLYLFFTLFIGIPIFITELIIGRNAQTGSVKAYTELAPKSTHWKLAGWLNIITSFLILSYYSVVAGWSVNYALMSLNQFTAGKDPQQVRQIFDIMYNSADINVFWHFIFMLMTVGVVYSGIRKGIEYWSKILTPTLLLLLVGLFIFSATLPGFKEALKFTFLPNPKTFSPNSVLDALGMSFFTLSVGLGIILTYGSYMKKTNDIPKTGFIIGSVSVAVSLLAALMIFPIIFTFNFSPEEGPGLVFKTLPVLFAKLPGTLIISTVFFLLFVFTALTSSISLLEVLVANLTELFHWTRPKAVVLSGLFAFLMGIPTAVAGSGVIFGNWKRIYGSDFFETINYITGSWLMPIGGLLSVIFAGWFMSKEDTIEEFSTGSSLAKLARYWLFLIKWLVPLAIFLIILQQSGIL